MLCGCTLCSCTLRPAGETSGEDEISPEEQAKYDEMAKALAERITHLNNNTVPDPEPTGDALLDQINVKRAEYGSEALTLSDTLMKAAVIRAAELENAPLDALHTRQDGTAWSTILTEFGIDAEHCGETVLKGGADINTVFQAMQLNLNQTEYLTYSGYTQFGYAHNEVSDLWVLLLTE